ncbi:Beta-monoglucosyldiacylglycerol synthase [Halotydeus destructor]|nr:Beta-monoglucosyldiacylglycerol synthase [Halotydeus destructor]
MEITIVGLVSLISAVSVFGATLTLIVGIYNWWATKYMNCDGVTTGPKVSVIVPARNEEDYLTNCLLSLAHQEYDNYEILVMDDDSTDKTLEIAQTLAKKFPRIKVFSSDKLRDGWFGKANAVDQLIRKASGEILFMTDSDSIHRPNSVGFAVKNMADYNCDFVSGWGRQEFGSTASELLLPTGWLMLGLNIYSSRILPRNPAFMYAIGSYICCKTKAMDEVGGMSSVRNSIGEDYALSLEFQKHGYTTVFLPLVDIMTISDRYEDFTKIFYRFSRIAASTMQENLVAGFLFLPIIAFMYVKPTLDILAYVLLGSDLTTSSVYIQTAIFLTYVLNVNIHGGLFNLVFYPVQAAFFLVTILHAIGKRLSGIGTEWKKRNLVC